MLPLSAHWDYALVMWDKFLNSSKFKECVLPGSGRVSVDIRDQSESIHQQKIQSRHQVDGAQYIDDMRCIQNLLINWPGPYHSGSGNPQRLALERGSHGLLLILCFDAPAVSCRDDQLFHN